MTIPLFTAPLHSGNVLIHNYSVSSFTLPQLLVFSYLVFTDIQTAFPQK